MYTVPVLKVNVGVRHLEGEAGQATQGQEEIVQAIEHYIERYQALGAIAKPDEVARSVFETYPGFELIEVNVTQHMLDRNTARVVKDRTDQFRYRRGSGLEKAE